ncbi:MAG: hypothetical protein GWP69_12245 [Gammaproteobacteria bacterium]|nr:hypothetical protein [Gammaproteobacteria bacterium]
MACRADEQKKLERLTRYVARPPLALERLSRDGDDLVNTAFTSKRKASVSCSRAELWWHVPCAIFVPPIARRRDKCLANSTK